MTRHHFHILMALTVVSGLLGGAASNLLLRAAPALAQGPEVADEVRAQRLVLMGAQGQEKAILGVNENGEPGLVMFDEAGNNRLSLQLNEGDPDLTLYDADVTPRASFNLSLGQPVLALYDEEAEPRAILAAMGGDPGMQLYDGTGQSRVQVGSADSEYPISTITLCGENGDVLWQAP